MNKKIIPIVDRVWAQCITAGEDGMDTFDGYKFAELIAEECLNVIDDEQLATATPLNIWDKVREHFGIE
jgi:acetylornithine/succinyldiaminopimelate/putrescine aminotransferase